MAKLRADCRDCRRAASRSKHEGPMTVKPFTICLIIAAAAAGSVAAELSTAETRAKAKDLFGVIPDKMPGGQADTPARVALGRKLYFEKRLSKDQTISCNSCHRLDEFQGGTDNSATS